MLEQLKGTADTYEFRVFKRDLQEQLKRNAGKG